MHLRKLLTIGAIGVLAGVPSAGCIGDDGPDDGGPVTADTGPTTPTDTNAQTGTPEAPTLTDATSPEDTNGRTVGSGG